MITTDYDPYIGIDSRAGTLETLCNLFKGPRLQRAAYVLDGPSGHGKSFLCAKVLRKLEGEGIPGRTFVKVGTSTQERSLDTSGAYLLEIAAAVVRKHSAPSDPLAPLAFLESRNDPIWQRLAGIYRQLPPLANGIAPWSIDDLPVDVRLTVAEAYLRTSLRHHCHVLNIENAQAIDRVSLLALRKALVEAQCGYLLLEYTTDAQWAEWTKDELLDYLSKEGGVRTSDVPLPPVTEQESIYVLNHKLAHHNAGQVATTGARNLRVGDTVIATFLSKNWGLFMKFLGAEPSMYLEPLPSAQKQILALLALYGSAVRRRWLAALVKNLGRRRNEDMALKQDIDQLASYGLIKFDRASHEGHVALVHDFDRLSVLQSEVFADARSKAAEAWLDFLAPQKERWFQDIALRRDSGEFAAIWGGDWYIRAALGDWQGLRGSVKQVLAHPGVQALPEVVRELRRLIVVLKSHEDDGTRDLKELKSDLGWMVALNLYNTQEFDQAAGIADGLEEAGPLSVALNCILDATHRSAKRGLERIAVNLDRLNGDGLRLDPDLHRSMELLLRTARVHAHLECWNLHGYRNAYERLWAEHWKFSDLPGWSSFLRLTRSELRVGGEPIGKDNIRSRFKDAIRFADQHGNDHERAACRITYSQELGDMVETAEDVWLLDEAARLLDEAESIVQYVAFDTHSIMNNRGALALIRHGLPDAAPLPQEELQQAIDNLRAGARDCSYDYGILMLLSNLALAQAFAGYFDPLADIDRRVSMILDRCGEGATGIEDADMRRLGWLNTGFALALCPPSPALPDPKARARFYLNALRAEAATSEEDWITRAEHLAAAIEAPPRVSVTGKHFKPVLMAFWHPTLDLRLPLWPAERRECLLAEAQ